MASARVALVTGESVLRVSQIQLDHHPVAVHLGDDRRRGDGYRAFVTANNGRLREWGSGLEGAVDENPIGPWVQFQQGFSHRLQGSLQDVELVDLRDLDGRYRGAMCLFENLPEKPLAHLRLQLLRIVDLPQLDAWAEGDGRGHHWPGQTPAADFVHSCHHLNPRLPESGFEFPHPSGAGALGLAPAHLLAGPNGDPAHPCSPVALENPASTLVDVGVGPYQLVYLGDREPFDDSGCYASYGRGHGLIPSIVRLTRPLGPLC